VRVVWLTEIKKYVHFPKKHLLPGNPRTGGLVFPGLFGKSIKETLICFNLVMRDSLLRGFYLVSLVFVAL